MILATLNMFALACLVLCLLPGVNGQNVEHIKKMIDSPLDDIQWVNEKTVFVLSEKGNLYRSSDGGKSWKNQMSKLSSAGGSTSKIAVAAIDVSKVSKSNIFFRGAGKGNWFTTDMGNTYEFSPMNIHDVRLHPTQSSRILASTMSPGCGKGNMRKSEETSPCFKSLHVSVNFGKTWKHCTDYVVQFDWSAPVSSGGPGMLAEDLVYATVHSTKVGDQRFGFWDKNIHFVQSFDWFNSSQIAVQHGNRFLFGEGNYLFVAAVNPTDENEVTLEVSRDNSTAKNFIPAYLPVDLSEHSYTILDTSEGSVFLHVNHRPFSENAQTGHVYVSDASGTRYSLSLPYNHRSGDGKCDFEKIENLEGVYMANFVDVEDKLDDNVEDEEEEEMAQAKRKKHKKDVLKTKTVITFDKGGEWSYLPPPRRDSNDKPIKCSGECHLHLHGVTDLYGPFYSSPSSIGIIMSTGTVGRYLRQNNAEINTYLSRDAGLTWSEVAKGSHIYEMGDHGGLLVMANDDALTDHVLYSWNEGVTWTRLQISDEPFQIENIIIEPSSTALEFIVYGWAEESGVLVYLDFSDLHQQTCQGHDSPDTSSSDYETWSPSDGRLGGKCLMGHTVTYIRRKPEKQCFNPEMFERPTFVENCACTRHDFECDYGYEPEAAVDESSSKCVEMKMSPKHADPFVLRAGDKCVGSYRVTKGYRRIPGDTCTGGAEWDAMEAPCPSAWLKASHSGKLVLIILALVVVALGLATAASKFQLLDGFGETLKQRFSEARYKMVGGKYPDSMTDDDAFYLNDDEFNTSAHLINDNDDDSQVIDTSGTEFAPLPTRKRNNQNVPVLAPPSSADSFDDL
mmetsp:Transcript_43514/g.85182  ORF Transcript_43514/g.85182 Transcript_43514/m.85182 type:complete len:845 (-) Transcript_43514:294-2828(-)